MLVFDKWTCNTNGRQTLFFEEQGPPPATAPSGAPGESPCAAGSGALPYRTLMIDHGFCFNAGEWNFPDAPLRGLYARNRVYEGVTGMESFGPWLERLEHRITERVLTDVAGEIPPEWYADDYDAVMRLLEQLLNRRRRVPELLLSARSSSRQPFPYWIRDS